MDPEQAVPSRKRVPRGIPGGYRGPENTIEFSDGDLRVGAGRKLVR